MKLKLVFTLIFISSSYCIVGQNAMKPVKLYLDGGTDGIGTSSSGNVGIGVQNPLESLHLVGSIRGNQSGALRISSGNGYIDVGAKNSSWAHIYTDRPNFLFNKAIYLTGGVISSYSSSNLNFQTNGTTRMTITPGGCVGIGCNPDNVAFKVYKSFRPSMELGSDKALLEIGIAENGEEFNNGSRPGDVVFRCLGSGGHNSLIFGIPNNSQDKQHYIGFGDIVNGVWVKIFNDRCFNVDGTIFATEIQVKANVWADDVFDADYKMKSLDEVKTYIDEYKTLPDVPSEKEVIENGINVVDMNAILLRKIEELTLYMIDLQEQNRQLEKRVEVLEK